MGLCALRISLRLERWTLWTSATQGLRCCSMHVMNSTAVFGLQCVCEGTVCRFMLARARHGEYLFASARHGACSDHIWSHACMRTFRHLGLAHGILRAACRKAATRRRSRRTAAAAEIAGSTDHTCYRSAGRQTHEECSHLHRSFALHPVSVRSALRKLRIHPD